MGNFCELSIIDTDSVAPAMCFYFTKAIGVIVLLTGEGDLYLVIDNNKIKFLSDSNNVVLIMFKTQILWKEDSSQIQRQPENSSLKGVQTYL